MTSQLKKKIVKNINKCRLCKWRIYVFRIRHSVSRSMRTLGSLDGKETCKKVSLLLFINSAHFFQKGCERVKASMWRELRKFRTVLGKQMSR